jgi:ubiquinone/menaquinone biosynthesis C-methylase UbiE
MYRHVARDPHGDFHFELGRGLAERLGYPAELLDRVPAEAVESFAGVGYHLDLAALQPGEHVADLGSGSGTDVFAAACQVGPRGAVHGVEMTDDQLAKAEALRMSARAGNARFKHAHIEELPFEDGSLDAVISNGVINLVQDKRALFGEIARVLRPGGRMAVSDIVTDQQIAQRTVAKADLWAACVAGAAQRHGYRDAIEAAGLHVTAWRENAAYRFTSERAQTTSAKYGVRSVSLVAVRTR